MRIIRETYERCQKVKMILQTHMLCYEERDIFMSRENQLDLMERLNMDAVIVPQVFADGQHLGVRLCIFSSLININKFGLNMR